MSNEELFQAIQRFQSSVMSPRDDLTEETDKSGESIISIINKFVDEYQMKHTLGDEEKEEAYVRSIFEMASKEFL